VPRPANVADDDTGNLQPSVGNPAILDFVTSRADRRLCVPTSRWVCQQAGRSKSRRAEACNLSAFDDVSSSVAVVVDCGVARHKNGTRQWAPVRGAVSRRAL